MFLFIIPFYKNTGKIMALSVVILAAGKGTRMRSALPKVLRVKIEASAVIKKRKKGKESIVCKF